VTEYADLKYMEAKLPECIIDLIKDNKHFVLVLEVILSL
jgi:hypothetical protein